VKFKSFKPSQSCRPGVSTSQTGNRETTIASILEIVAQNKKDNLVRHHPVPSINSSLPKKPPYNRHYGCLIGRHSGKHPTPPLEGR